MPRSGLCRMPSRHSGLYEKMQPNLAFRRIRSGSWDSQPEVLASTASTHFETQVGEITDASISVRPDFSLLIYPVITFNKNVTHAGSRENLIGKTPTQEKVDLYSNDLHVRTNTPPAFLISTTDDFVSPENSILYFQACRKNNVPVEMHIYEKGGHGYALKKKGLGPVETWPDRMEDWMRERKLMK